MRFDVKITTFLGLLDLLCPHYCRGCGRLGRVLCERCKVYNVLNIKNHCPACGREIGRICKECRLPFEATFMCGWRDGMVGTLAEEYKYHSVREMGVVLAEIIDEKMPVVLGEVVVVPLPTIRKHIRQRGLDHTLTVARELAGRRGWKCEQVLERRKNTVQVGASAQERLWQAEQAYGVRRGVKLRSEVTYILYDDVWTTGASMMAACEALREMGAEKVMAVVAAVSRLEE